MKQTSWAYCESVLVDGDHLICTPGGKDAALVALNKMTGETVWKCALRSGRERRVLLTDADHRRWGEAVRHFPPQGAHRRRCRDRQAAWRYNKIADFGANIMTPVVYQDKVFASSSRGGGSVLELKGKDEPKEVYLRQETRHEHRRGGARRWSSLRHDRHRPLLRRVRHRQGEVAGRTDRRREYLLRGRPALRPPVLEWRCRPRGTEPEGVRREGARQAAGPQHASPPGRTRSSPTAASSSAITGRWCAGTSRNDQFPMTH